MQKGVDRDVLLPEVSSEQMDQSQKVKKIVKDLMQESSSTELENQFHKYPNAQFISQPMRGMDLMKQFEGWRLAGETDPLPRGEGREVEIKKRMQDFIGDINEEEFKQLDDKIGKAFLSKELRITSPNMPEEDTLEHFSRFPVESKLRSHKVLKSSLSNSEWFQLGNLLKYRGDKGAMTRNFKWMEASGADDMRPGTVVLYFVKIYRPIRSVSGGHQQARKYSIPTIQPQQELVFHGGQTLKELRDQFKCPNDLGPRHDVSDAPNEESIEFLKDVFPSCTLFINNIFYNDPSHSVDYSEPIRKWAKEKKIADLRARSIDGVTLDSIEIRLGHPELYIHQGNCEHLFTFTQMRLLHPTDVCVSSFYPYNTSINLQKATLCIICGRFNAQWIVTESERIPFDPGYLCSLCFKLYNYVDGRKVGNFKAYKCFDRNPQ